MCACATANVQGEQNQYFAGKDELCLSKDIVEIVVKPQKLTASIDFYKHGDNEFYCQLIIDHQASAELGNNIGLISKYPYLSVSKSKCMTLMYKTDINFLELEVIGNHVCKVNEPNE